MKQGKVPQLKQTSMLNYMPRKDAETTASNAPLLPAPRAPTIALTGNLQIVQTVHETTHPDGTVVRQIVNYGSHEHQTSSGVARVGEKRLQKRAK